MTSFKAVSHLAILLQSKSETESKPFRGLCVDRVTGYKLGYRGLQLEMTDDADALFTEATALHSSGINLRRPEALYRKILAVHPRHAHALHQLGALLTQLYGKEKDSEALRLVTAAVQLQPGNSRFRNSLGVVHQAAARWVEAADAFERANEKDPLNVQVMMNLARALREAGRQQRAAEVYGAVTKLQPDHPAAHYRRGAILRSIRRNDVALVAFRQHLRLFPDHQPSKFWVAAITGDAEAMAVAPAEMVAGLFDQYAEHFDDHLINKLQYRTPEALRDQLLASFECTAQPGSSNKNSSSSSNNGNSNCNGVDKAKGGACTTPRWRRCVDLGCGTGLMGPLLLPYCDVIEGVDLSSGMVEQAAKRGCYSRLTVTELVSFLDAEAVAAGASAIRLPYCNASTITTPNATAPAVPPSDLLVAADVFVYIGDLEPVMRAAAAATSPDAVFAFSAEALELAAEGKANRANRRVASAAAAICTGEPLLSSGPEVQHSEGDGKGEGTGSVDRGDRGTCPGLQLQVTGRYAHSRDYLERTARRCGWEFVSVLQSVVRNNGGEPIWGHLCVMRRAGPGLVGQPKELVGEGAGVLA